MSNGLLVEWIAFTKLENEELDKEIKQKSLEGQALRDVQEMRARRGKHG